MRPAHSKRALFHPRSSQPWCPLHQILERLGVETTSEVDEDYDFAVAFHWTTYPEYERDPVLTRLRERGMFVVNYAVNDISKRRVDDVQRRAFGYGAAIEPTRYQRAIVEKSDRNYRHDGRVLNGPLCAEDLAPDKVYVREIDNRLPDGGHEDIRVVIVDRAPCFAASFSKCADGRFGTQGDAAYAVRSGAPDAFFSPAERDALARFAALYQLDYGELDVLRDYRDGGRVFVVDVNITPGSGLHFFGGPSLRELWKRMRPGSERAFRKLIRDAVTHYLPAVEAMLATRVYRS